MNLEKVIENKSEWTKYINIFLIIAIGVAGYIFYSNSKTPKQSSSQSIQTNSQVQIKKKFIIDISGAVKKPGVYEFDEGSRIVDVIEKAEGFSDQVDMTFVDKSINKAQKISDGLKIYIPKVGDASTQVSNSNQDIQKTSGPVNINTASSQQLVDLPEIGEVTAEKIIQNRPYSSLDEMVKKGSLKQSQLDKIKDLITY